MSLPIGMRCLCMFEKFRQAKIIGHQIFILCFTFCVYASYHLSRKPITVVKTSLKGTDSCNHTSTPNCTQDGWAPFNGANADELLGALDLAYLFAYAVGMFFSGHIAERTNMRHFLTIGMIGSGIMTILFGLGRLWKIHSFAYYVAVQIVCGLVQSTGWPPVVAIVANWFGKGGRGIIFGIWNVHTYVGNIIGSEVGSAVLRIYGDDNWALAFIIPGIIIIIMAVLVFFFLIPHPKDLKNYVSLRQRCSVVTDEDETVESDENKREQDDDETATLIQSDQHQSPTDESAVSFIGALRIPGVIEFSLSLFFAKLVCYTFLYWMPNYISVSEHISPSKAADLSIFFDVGGMIGGIVAGVFSDQTGARASTCIIMMALAVPAMLAYEAWALVSNAANITLLIVGGCLVNGPYSLITTAVSADLGQSLQSNAKALATVSAIIDGTGSIGAAIGPMLAGVISPSGWSNVFWMLIGANIAALVLLLRIGVKEIIVLGRRCCFRGSYDL